MFNVKRSTASRLVTATLCIAFTACGGTDDSASNNVPAGSVMQKADEVSPPPTDAQMATVEKPSVKSSAKATVHGVRAEVAEFINTFAATEAHRLVLNQAATALQATLIVNLASHADLQLVVDRLAQAQTCLHAQLPDSAAAWSLLTVRTYDTLLRRLRGGAFLLASKLFKLQPTNLACPNAQPASVGQAGNTGPQTPPPSPPPAPSEGQQLREEIARLEQQGVLPILDRSTDIGGPDANNNGVRDDIDTYINALSLTDPQRKATLQTARVQQRSLLADLSDKLAVNALGEASMAATACIGDQFEPDRRQSYEVAKKIEAITANTPERAKRYMQYMAALSGTSTAYPQGNACED